MRTLSEITAAVRQGDPVTGDELRYAVVAYDVMVAQMELPNDPALPAVRQWYTAMHRAGEDKRAPGMFETCEACAKPVSCLAVA